MRDLILLIDEREKRPLPIPPFLRVWDPSSSWENPSATRIRILTATTRLKTGDYVLQGHESSCIIERKGHLNELHTNLLTATGRRRFTAELERLRSSCAHPILLLEGSPLTLTAVRPPADADLVRDHLLSLLLAYSVTLHILPTDSPSSRRCCGEWLVATLFAAAHTNPVPRPETTHAQSHHVQAVAHPPQHHPG